MSRLRLAAPSWGRLPAIAAVLVCALVVPASGQPKNKGNDKGGKANATGTAEPKPESGDAKAGDAKTDAKTDTKAPKNAKPKTYDFTALDLNGRMRSPQLLYFLERANEELERASLEKRSFIPHMVRSLEEEQL